MLKHRINHRTLVVLDLFPFGPKHTSNSSDTALGPQLCGEADLADSCLGSLVATATSNINGSSSGSNSSDTHSNGSNNSNNTNGNNSSGNINGSNNSDTTGSNSSNINGGNSSSNINGSNK